MKILVVEDHVTLRQTLAHILRNQRDDIQVIEAGCLDEARDLIDQADAVLCDASFPSHSSAAMEPRETMTGNWAPVHLMASKLSIPFVMLSGNAILVDRLREKGTEAFTKPSGAVEAVRRVTALAAIHAGEFSRPIEDPRIQQADINSERIESDEEPAGARQTWWKRFRD